MSTRILDRSRDLRRSDRGIVLNLEARASTDNSLQERECELVRDRTIRPLIATKKIAAALAAVSRENLSRANLMAVTGHDLKQPLQVLCMILDLLESNQVSAEGKKRAQIAQESIARISAGLDELALASSVGHAFHTPCPLTFPISDILLLTKATWSQHAAQKNVRLHVVQSTAYVTSDAVMLTTVIGNLVGNAIKYAVNGKVLVGCRRRGDDLLIQVLDSGLGIPGDRLKTIFDAFHQQNTEAEGVGLGLSVVRSTAAALGHRVDVRIDGRPRHGFYRVRTRSTSPSMTDRRKTGSGIQPQTIKKETDLEMAQRHVRGGERRVKKQENVVAMLKARQLPSERDEELLVLFEKSHVTQAEHLETLLADDERAKVRKSHEL